MFLDFDVTGLSSEEYDCPTLEMHSQSLKEWEHDHSFGQDRRKPGESRTIWVIALTTIMMVVEISAGIIYGSMALLADGLHMASHAAALCVSAFSYVYARKKAHDQTFSFGTGKVNTLGGYTGALLLALFALMMAWESVSRFISPVPITYNQAILVAVLGLIVNGVSVFILGVDDHHHHGHEHGHDHGHGHHHHNEDDHKHHHHHDHNLRAAYLHVLADALTSVFAIVALLCAKYFGWNWMDPFMGIVGSVLVGRWSIGLLKSSARVLLDRQLDQDQLDEIRSAIQGDGDSRVSDLHAWSIGPGIHAAEIAIVAHETKAADEYRRRLPSYLNHATIEVIQCPQASERTAGGDASQEDAA